MLRQRVEGVVREETVVAGEGDGDKGMMGRREVEVQRWQVIEV